jgi:hypothetical protein
MDMTYLATKKKSLGMLLYLVLFGVTLHSFALTTTAISKAGSVSSGLVGFWTFDGKDTSFTASTTNDLSGNNNTATTSSMTTTSLVAGKIGQAFSFNGTNQYISQAATTSLNLGNAFSLAAWVYVTTPVNASIISKQFTTSVPYALGFGLASGSSTQMDFGFYDGASWRLVSQSGTFSSGQWVHVVGTWNGTTASLYINGVLNNSSTPGGTAVDNASAIYFGRRHDSFFGTQFFKGRIDDIHIYNRAISATEVATLFGANKAKVITPNKTNLSAQWKFDEGSGLTAKDASGNGNTGAISGTPTWSTAKIGNTALTLGATTYVTGTGNALPNLGANATATITAWIKPTSVAGTQTIFSKGASASCFNYGMTLTAGLLKARNTSNDRSLAGTIVANQWQHVAIVFTNAGAQGYINGVSVGSDASAGTTSCGDTNWIIGGRAYNATTTENVSGQVDDIKIYQRALTATELAYLYKAEQETHAVSVSKGQESGLRNGLVGWWTFDGKNINNSTSTDSSLQGNDGTLTNSPVPSAGVLGQGLKFNGSNNLVNVANSGTLNQGSGDFSVSVWVFGITPTNADGVVGKYTSGPFNPSGTGWDIRLRSSATTVEACVNGGSGTCPRVSGNLRAGRWNHIVFTVSRTNTLSSLYINGVFSASMAYAPTYTDTFPLVIGRDFDTFFPGKIDDVRIYNRTLGASEVSQLYKLGAR